MRWRLGGPPGRELYDAAHIPGAVFVDLDRDLAAPPGEGGRHPMPATADFEKAMRLAGVSDGRPVVVYDDADSTAAARAWWLLRYFGHPSVRVLDGGFRAWTAAGYPVDPPSPIYHGAIGDFTARPGHLDLLDCRRRRGPRPRPACCSTRERASGTGVRPSTSTRWQVTSPARSAPRRPRTSTRTAPSSRRRTWRPGSTALGATADRPVAAYCGSGVTAAHEVLALTLAGIPAALYVGSWSNWITDPTRPIATGPSPE